MSSPPVPPLSPTPKRRPFHGRTSSQSNNNPPHPASTLRLVPADDDYDTGDSDREANVYSASPYPTQPAHFLPPTATGGRRVFMSTGGESSSRNPSSIQHESQSEISTVQDGNNDSSIWDGPRSSATSVLRSVEPHASDSEGEKSSSSDRSNIIALPRLPTTIRTVVQDLDRTPSPATIGSRSRAYTSSSDGTTVNVARIAYTSSPNVVSLTSSTPNVVHIGTSPNIVRSRLSDSSLYSANTLGTTRRYARGHRRQPNSIGGYVAGDRSSYQTSSIPSSPPNLRSYQSTSSFPLPRSESASFRPGTSSTRSPPSALDIRAALNSGVTAQYPTGTSTSWSGSWGDRSSAAPRAESDRSSTNYASGRQNPHLSTVSSNASSDNHSGFPLLTLEERQADFNRRVREIESLCSASRSNSRAFDASEWREMNDNLSSLRSPESVVRTKASLGTLSRGSTISRLDSQRTASRPVSSTSARLTKLPTWATLYYTAAGREVISSALSFVEASRPSSPRDHSSSHEFPSEPRFVSRAPVADISLPRTRPRQNTLPAVEEQKVEVGPDPLDPRSHWAGIVDEKNGNEPQQLPEQPSRLIWSPHLYPNRNKNGNRRSFWGPPALDESGEHFFSRRNMQVYSFLLGFIFPLGTFFLTSRK